MIEIERKFLVKSSEYKKFAFKVEVFTQAYISKNPARSVRIRIIKNEGFLTIKGISKNKGTTRFEWEKKSDPVEEPKLFFLTPRVSNALLIPNSEIFIF